MNSNYEFIKNTVDEILIEFPISEVLLNELNILFDDDQGNLKYRDYRNELILSVLVDEKKANNLKFMDLENIKNQFILEFCISDSKIHPYLSIIEKFRSILKNNKNFKSFNENEPWIKALKIAVYEFMVSGSNPEIDVPDFIERIYSRMYNVGKSARYLKDNGYKVRVENGKIKISEKEELRIIEDISEKIKLLGGQEVLFNIIKILKEQNFSKIQNRFFFPIYHSSGADSGKPTFPFGFLFNLALKYLSYLPRSSNPEYEWIELYKLSISYISAIYNSQSYSMFENLFLSPENLPQKIHDMTIYDTIFKIPQYSLKNVLDILSNLIIPLIAESERQEITEIISIINWIVENLKNDILIEIPISSIKIQNLNKDQIVKIIDDLSLKLENINSKYNYPYEFDKINILEKPFIKKQFHSYWMIDTHFSSVGLLESILSKYIYDKKNSSLDRIFGIEIETYIKNKMTSKGMNLFYGDFYKNNSNKIKEGECDIGIETKDIIILFEIKKKVLTDDARSGDDVDIFSDLTEVVHANSQLGRQELLFYKQGYIEYKKDFNSIRIESKGRPIERVIISFYDFGSLNSRILIMQLLTVLCQISLNANDSSRQNELKNLSDYSKKLIANTTELQKISESWKEAPFFNTWFLNLSQLLILLEGVQSNEDFKNNLWKTRHITFNTMDFCFEYEYMKKNG